MACVYQHVRLDTGAIFYIGMGKSTERAYAKGKKRRNAHWKSVVAKTDYRVDILFDDLTWEEALDKERELIVSIGRKDLGRGPLVNKTDGGLGAVGTKRPDLARYNQTRVNPLKGVKRPPEFGAHLSAMKTGVPNVSALGNTIQRGRKNRAVAESNRRRAKAKPAGNSTFRTEPDDAA